MQTQKGARLKAQERADKALYIGSINSGRLLSTEVRIEVVQPPPYAFLRWRCIGPHKVLTSAWRRNMKIVSPDRLSHLLLGVSAPYTEEEEGGRKFNRRLASNTLTPWTLGALAVVLVTALIVTVAESVHQFVTRSF